ncbi:zinc metalloprotease HtpX [candidate division FCPU426 bacterium]|nr:zinc metalloprotease HtpX [candidate division FCPU426 bacterium]
MKNIFKTFLLLLGMTLLFLWIGNRVGGTNGMMVALLVAVVFNFGSYWFSDKIVLAMYRARDPKPREQRVVALVGGLAEQAGLPVPAVKIIDESVPNAFATGRNPHHAVVAVTTGILAILNERELAAVLAHELTHVRNRDILIGAVAATMAGAIVMLARLAFFFGGSRDRNLFSMLIMLILAPVAAMLIQMAISRSREYAADRGAGLLTRRPADLVSALEKLHAVVKRQPMPAPAGADVTAHLFIVNPFTLRGLASLFSTHPSLEQRAERLLALEQEMPSAGR